MAFLKVHCHWTWIFLVSLEPLIGVRGCLIFSKNKKLWRRDIFFLCCLSSTWRSGLWFWHSGSSSQVKIRLRNSLAPFELGGSEKLELNFKTQCLAIYRFPGRPLRRPFSKRFISRAYEWTSRLYIYIKLSLPRTLRRKHGPTPKPGSQILTFFLFSPTKMGV